MPQQSANVEDAVKESKRQGLGCLLSIGDDGEQVRKEVLVWHFSGTCDTQPWLFLDKATAVEVRMFAAKSWFVDRGQCVVVATAMAEWREALDDLLKSRPEDELSALRHVVNALVHGETYPTQLHGQS